MFVDYTSFLRLTEKKHKRVAKNPKKIFPSF